MAEILLLTKLFRKHSPNGEVQDIKPALDAYNREYKREKAWLDRWKWEQVQREARLVAQQQTERDAQLKAEEQTHREAVDAIRSVRRFLRTNEGKEYLKVLRASERLHAPIILAITADRNAGSFTVPLRDSAKVGIYVLEGNGNFAFYNGVFTGDWNRRGPCNDSMLQRGYTCLKKISGFKINKNKLADGIIQSNRSAMIHFAGQAVDASNLLSYVQGELQSRVTNAPQ